MRKNNVQINFRVSEGEYFKLKRLARQAGLSVTGFCKKRIFDDEKIIIQDGDSVREVYKELNAIGNNINQVARIANGSGQIDREIVLEVLSVLYELKLAVDMKLKGICGSD